MGCTSVSISGWVKNVFTDQRSNENTTASESWVIGTFAAKSWPYILKSCEPNPSVAYMHCMRNYLSLRVYLNNSLFPNQRGPNSSMQNIQECLELATLGPSAASLLVGLLAPPLASGCLCGFLHVSQDTHGVQRQYVTGLVMTHKQK